MSVIYPSTFEEKIGFTQIRKMLGKLCISAMGLEKAHNITFSADCPLIELSLDQTEAMMRLMDQGIPFVVADYPDLRGQLHHLRVEGTVIEQEDLFLLKCGLVIAQQLVRFAQSEASQPFQTLRDVIGTLSIDKNILREIERIMDDRGEIPDRASDLLAEIRQDIRRKQGTIARKIRQLLGEAKSSGWADSDVEATIRNGRMVIPVRAADKRKLRGFIHDESASGQTVYIEPAEIFDTNNEIRELEYAEKREIQRILSVFSQHLRPFLPELLLIWEMMGEIDLIHAKARLARKIGGLKPQLDDRPVFNWKQAVHPLLEISLREQHKTTVPLDLYLDEHQRILVISGPNAGGKSVCLKTTGLLQYMLQCGLMPPMHPDSVCGIFQRIFIDIGDEQSLENDLSTYSSHLMHMAFFLENANAHTLFLIDEFGTGTEPQSGGAIAEAVLEQLNENKAFGLITTHYANLKLLADKQSGIINGAMLFDTNRLQPLYLLQTGKPGSSFAFEIARKTGIPEKVLEKAATITGFSQLNFEQQLQQLELEKRELTRKQLELRVADNLLNEVVEKYQRLLRQLEEKKKSILTEAGREAKTLIEKANRQIELTIKEIREADAEKEKTRLLRQKLQNQKTEFEREAGQLAEAMKVEQPDEREISSELKPGMMVRIEEMGITGELVSINAHEAVVVFNSVRLRTSPEKLSAMGKAEQRRAERLTTRKKGGTYTDDINEKAAQFSLTIDVRGKRADEALELIGKYLDEAMLLSIKEVSILHGKGNGILRRVIREMLANTKEVNKFEDATLETGGHGITRVKLR
ncbi:endonuclease MutS2 [Bacteroidales bacterium]